MGRVIQASLTGDHAKLGEVPARDFARLVLGIERTLAKECGHIVGRRVKATGRRERLIERATRLRLVSVEQGSVRGVLEVPDLSTEEEQELGLSAESLGEIALDRVLASVEGDQPAGHRDVLRSLVRLTEELAIGIRYEELVLEDYHAARKMRRRAVIDLSVRDRLRRLVEPDSEPSRGSLVGVLVEADFEDHTARLRTASKQAVEVRFDHDTADRIQEALRQEAEFEGEVTYDRETMTAKSVRLRRIARPEQLVLDSGARDFWRLRTVSEIAEEQGVLTPPDLQALKDLEATEEEIDAFFEALNLEAR